MRKSGKMMVRTASRILLSLFVCISIHLSAQAYDTVHVAARFSVHMQFEEDIVDTECLPAISLVEGSERLTQMELAVEGDRLTLYANLEGFPTSNLYVETTERTYIFILAYDPAPKTLFHHVRPSDAVHTKVAKHTTNNEKSGSEQFSDSNDKVLPLNSENRSESLENSEMAEIAAQVALERATMLTGQQKQRMTFALGVPFVDGGLTYLPVLLENASSIPYRIRGDIIFIAKEKDKRKRQTVTPVEHVPVYVHGSELDTVEKGDPLVQVYVFENFTLQEGQRMYVHLIEDGGGRDMTLSFDNRGLLKARTW